MTDVLPPEGLDLLFRKARTHNGWQDAPVSDDLLLKVVELASTGPTAFNQQPIRVIFVRSDEEKARLAPALSRGNLEKTMAAPAVAILCYDLDFWKHLDAAAPGFDAASMFDGNRAAALESAQRNGSLQAGYFILAARALGLDTGPMSGFDKQKVADAFLTDHPSWEVNMLVNLGHGNAEALRPQRPRHAPEFTASIV
ncbi:malonic semialdehyde reductase [Falsirhodobacter xinxiangensis]|uniref:malonic semialdehyde reductase n=1 Tax=Falsirhodobacter xinxiangensis TaxID=2530049 RepID=UPI0010AA5B32|nr:malonic semialdehyde reductase [Rhodobacter xinxiangensis]